MCVTSLYMCAFLCPSMWLIIYLISPHTFVLSVTPSVSLGKLLKQWQMASWVTFADIQGSAFITTVHLGEWNPFVPLRWPGGLSLCRLSLPLSLSIPVPKWMPSVQGNGKVARGFAAALKCHAGEKIFNGLSVAFPALTCQVIRNVSLTPSLLLSSPSSSSFLSSPGLWHTTNYLLFQS